MNEFQEVSNKDLSRGYYWLTHQQKYRKIFLAFFGLIIILLYAIFALNLIRLLNQPAWQEMAVSLNQKVNWQSWHQSRQPQTLQLSPAQYFPIGGNRYNLVAFIKNPNPDWLVKEFEYNFIVNGQSLGTQTGSLNPEDNKMVLQLGHVSTAGIKSLEVKLNNNIFWQRLDANTPTLAWEINEIKYQPATTMEINKEKVKLPPRLSWEAKNLTLFNFWTVPFQVALYNQDKLVAVNRIQAENFNALESRIMEAVWLQDIGRVTDYVVTPDVSWLDSENFRQSETPVREDERFNL